MVCSYGKFDTGPKSEIVALSENRAVDDPLDTEELQICPAPQGRDPRIPPSATRSLITARAHPGPRKLRGLDPRTLLPPGQSRAGPTAHARTSSTPVGERTIGRSGLARLGKGFTRADSLRRREPTRPCRIQKKEVRNEARSFRSQQANAAPRSCQNCPYCARSVEYPSDDP